MSEKPRKTRGSVGSVGSVEEARVLMYFTANQAIKVNEEGRWRVGDASVIRRQ